MISNLRIGNGYDVHSLAPGLAMWLGGIQIPHHSGFVAHSDGDVLIHSLCDAMLGAAAMGDIGSHFPDTDARFKGIDSKHLLRSCCHLVTESGYTVINCDCTILAQAPKLRPYIDTMRASLATVMGLEMDAISVKATTTEGLGFTGREEGVAVYSTVLMIRNA